MPAFRKMQYGNETNAGVVVTFLLKIVKMAAATVGSLRLIVAILAIGEQYIYCVNMIAS